MSLGLTSRIDELNKKQIAEFDAQIKRSKRIKKQKRSIKRSIKKQKRGTKEILDTPITYVIYLIQMKLNMKMYLLLM